MSDDETHKYRNILAGRSPRGCACERTPDPNGFCPSREVQEARHERLCISGDVVLQCEVKVGRELQPILFRRRPRLMVALTPKAYLPKSLLDCT